MGALVALELRGSGDPGGQKPASWVTPRKRGIKGWVDLRLDKGMQSK